MYEVVLVRHRNDSGANVCVFYDERVELALSEMSNYVRQNGFSIKEKDKRYSIADVILREIKSTGEVVGEIPYYKLFNTVTGDLLKR